MLDPNEAFKIGNISIPTNINNIQSRKEISTSRDEQQDESAGLEALSFFVSYYGTNDISKEIPLPAYSSVLEAGDYRNFTYYLDLYLSHIGCPGCYLIQYAAGCTSDFNFQGGNVYTESNSPSDGNLIMGFYDSLAQVEEQLPGTVDISGVPTTVVVDEYYCGAGNYIYYLKKYIDLQLSTSQCNNYRDNDPDKEVEYLDSQDLSLSISDTSGLGPDDTNAFLNQLYQQYNENYIDTHIVCTERFYEI